jgi:hypothetical protein
MADARTCTFASSTACGLCLPGMHDGLKKCTRRQDYCFCSVYGITPYSNADDSLWIDRIGENLFDHFLSQIEVRRLFDHTFDFKLVRFFVRLCTRRVHRRTFSVVEHPKLDSSFIDRLPHEPTQRIDFAYNLPLCNTADCGVTTHLTNGI